MRDVKLVEILIIEEMSERPVPDIMQQRSGDHAIRQLVGTGERIGTATREPRDPEALDSFLTLTELPFVKLAEFGLVFLLAVHAFGGLRLMALEHLNWTSSQKTLAAASVGLAILVSGTFFLRAI